MVIQANYPFTQIVKMCCFFSGTFTTAVAMDVFLLLMAHHQQLQSQLAEQINNNIGQHRLPEPGDRQRLPLMEAAILELLRYISHVPLSLPHYTLCDTSLGGYKIAKNTQV